MISSDASSWVEEEDEGAKYMWPVNVLRAPRLSLYARYLPSTRTVAVCHSRERGHRTLFELDHRDVTVADETLYPIAVQYPARQ
jgi:hypothetical protein